MSTTFRANFNLGAMMAESDQFLVDAYYDNGDFEAIASQSDRRCFVIGRTGAGKSAAFRLLEENFRGKVIRISPEDLSFQYLSSLDLIDNLVRLQVSLEPFFTALWKHVLIVEIIKHRYGIANKEKKINTLNVLREKFKRDPAKGKALQYLEEFGDKFWAETDERVKQVTDNFVEKFSIAGEAGFTTGVANAKGQGNYEHSKTHATTTEIARKYDQIVQDAQLPRLNQVSRILGNEILDSSQHFTYLIIDDLDKEWVNEKLANSLIRCLFQAVLDMQQVRNLKIIIALRTNIFQQLDYGAQSRGGQEEKFRGSSLHLQWKANDLRGLLNQRTEVASKSYGFDPPRTIEELLPQPSKAEGDPLRYILDRTLMRPRDGIQFVNECLRDSAGNAAISWKSIHSAERRYSTERLLALRDEWKDPYLDIDKAFDLFRRAPARLDRKQLTAILDDIALLAADSDFHGNPWLQSIAEKIYSGNNMPWHEMYGPLVQLLYGMAFLGLAKSQFSEVTFSYQDEERANYATNTKDGTYFVIHCAFHQALDLNGDAGN